MSNASLAQLDFTFRPEAASVTSKLDFTFRPESASNTSKLVDRVPLVRPKHAPWVNDHGEREPLVPKAKRLAVGPKPSPPIMDGARTPKYHARSPPTVDAIVQQYEKNLENLQSAMSAMDADEVRHIVSKLEFMSDHLNDSGWNIDSYLDKGKFDRATRNRLRREYVRRYVLLRGGGPLEDDPAAADNSLLSASDDTDKYMSNLTEKNVRHGFVQKVYGILCTQLFFTAIIAIKVMYWAEDADPTTVSVTMIISSVIMLGTICLLVCKPGLTTQHPVNYIFLSVLTVAMAVLVGFISAQYTAESLIMVFSMTTVIVFGLSLFACQTTYDFTGYGPYLFVAMLVLMSLSFVTLIGVSLGYANHPMMQTARLVYAAIGALIFSCYIVYDTQLILGGRHKQKFPIDEYCMAALNIYLDIINLFVMLLELFGSRK